MMRPNRPPTRTVLAIVFGLACLLALGTCGSGPNSWTNLKLSGFVPSARFGQAMVYASVSGRIVMFGGAIDDNTLLNDTWIYDRSKNTWTELEPSGNLPPARRSAGALSITYNEASGKMLLLAGLPTANFGRLSDTTRRMRSLS